MRNILSATIIMLLSVAPAAADGPPDSLPPLPEETGEEICVGVLETCEAGLQSCQQDRSVAMSLLNECLGLPVDTSLEEAKKVSEGRKTTRKRIVRKRNPPKPRPEPTKPAAGPQGSRGEQGEKGADGADGKDGHSVVWSIRRLKPGKTCPAGGYLYMSGLDLDDDRSLDPTEAADLMALCHGKDGKDGVDGKDGNDGVRPTLGVGTSANALYARGRPDSYSVFATASLGWPLNDSVSLSLTGGVAPGLDAAMMLGAALDWRLGSASGLKTGLVYQVVGLTDNNFANDQFVLVEVGVYKDLNLYEGDSMNLNLRGEVSGLVGVDAFINSDRKARVAGGVGGGLGLRLEF